MTEEIKQQLLAFNSKCDDIIASKFLLATGKIGDLLRTTATLPAIIDLFSKCAENFDYQKAQEFCFLPSPSGTANKGILALPKENKDTVAFIFCLLMDIDNKELDFPSFIKTFFDVDGSYTEAYDVFCKQVIKPFKEAVDRAFDEPMPAVYAPAQRAEANVDQTPDAIEQPNREKLNKKEAFKALPELIVNEKEALLKSRTDETHKLAGKAILEQAYVFARKKDEKNVKALLTGYAYFLMVTGRIDVRAQEMLAILEDI